MAQENEIYLKHKIMKLKQNYPIDSINKEVEISNLIFSLKKIDFNSIIEYINDIFDLRIEKTQNELKEAISRFLDIKIIVEIENYWTKEIFNSKEFNYKLEDNNCIAKKINGNKQIIKSEYKLKEGNIYFFLFNINYTDNNYDFDIGFGNIELFNTKKCMREKGGICLSNKGLFIDGINVNEKIKIKKGEIFFFLILKEKKYFFLIRNGECDGVFNFNLTNIYALASIERNDDSVELKTYISL